MAKVSFETSNSIQPVGGANSVKFFSLPEDGDEAIVRIMYDSTAEFDIVTTHQIQTENGRFRNVNCIRDPREPIEKCPFCAADMPLKQRFFIRLLQYTKNNDGSVSVQPVIWERSITYASTIKSYIDNYGPLSEIICKIIRHGKHGDMQTKYEIVPNLSPAMYPPAVYPKIDVPEDSFKTLGTCVMDKSFEELLHYTQYGNFDVPESSNAPASVEVNIPAPTTTPYYTGTPTPQFTGVEQSRTVPMTGEQSTPQFSRPTRYY